MLDLSRIWCREPVHPDIPTSIQADCETVLRLCSRRFRICLLKERKNRKRKIPPCNDEFRKNQKPNGNRKLVWRRDGKKTDTVERFVGESEIGEVDTEPCPERGRSFLQTRSDPDSSWCGQGRRNERKHSREKI